MGNSYRRDNPNVVADFFSSRKFNETYFITSGTKRKRNEIRETKSFPRKMHIFLWGFLVVALNNLNLASSSDKIRNDGRENGANKSQLDMILAKLQRQQDEQKKEQQLMNEVLREEQLVNEVLRDQMQEQKHKIDKQEREIKQQRREIKELTKIKRDRRSDGDIEDHLKQFILNETKSMKQSILNETYALIDGLSQCQVGKLEMDHGFGMWQKISFERNFTQTPKVVASVAGFSTYSAGSGVNFGVYAQSPTTTKFELQFYQYTSAIRWVKVSWIACA